MIKILKDPEDIAQLINVSDDLEKVLHYSKGEIIQWLIEQTKLKENNRITIQAYMDGDKIKSYTILINGINPPFFRELVIIYYWWPLDNLEECGEEAEELFQAVLQAAKEINVTRITTTIINPRQTGIFMDCGWKPAGFRVSYDIENNTGE